MNYQIAFWASIIIANVYTASQNYILTSVWALFALILLIKDKNI